MSFILMVSNGSKYSDYQNVPVATVLTKDEAFQAIKDFNSWKSEVLDKFGDEDILGYLSDKKLGYDESKFFNVVPNPPFGKGKFEVNIYGKFSDYRCSFVEVDDLKLM